jgi:hypothetical protein
VSTVKLDPGSGRLAGHVITPHGAKLTHQIEAPARRLPCCSRGSQQPPLAGTACEVTSLIADDDHLRAHWASTLIRVKGRPTPCRTVTLMLTETVRAASAGNTDGVGGRASAGSAGASAGNYAVSCIKIWDRNGAGLSGIGRQGPAPFDTRVVADGDRASDADNVMDQRAPSNESSGSAGPALRHRRSHRAAATPVGPRVQRSSRGLIPSTRRPSSARHSPRAKRRAAVGVYNLWRCT